MKNKSVTSLRFSLIFSPVKNFLCRYSYAELNIIIQYFTQLCINMYIYYNYNIIMSQKNHNPENIEK